MNYQNQIIRHWINAGAAHLFGGLDAEAIGILAIQAISWPHQLQFGHFVPNDSHIDI